MKTAAFVQVPPGVAAEGQQVVTVNGASVIIPGGMEYLVQHVERIIQKKVRATVAKAGYKAGVTGYLALRPIENGLHEVVLQDRFGKFICPLDWKQTTGFYQK